VEDVPEGRTGTWRFVVVALLVVAALLVPWSTTLDRTTLSSEAASTPGHGGPGDVAEGPLDPATGTPGSIVGGPAGTGPGSGPTGTGGGTGTPGTTGKGSATGTGGGPITAPGGGKAAKITVGYISLKTQGFGINSPDAGNADLQLKALAAYVNAHGGIAGMELATVRRESDSTQGNEQTEQAMCTAFSQDDKTFAVVLQGQRFENTRVCYRNSKVLAFDPSPFPFDKTFYEQMNGYLWTPSYPTLSRSTAALVPQLHAVDFFKGGTLGVVHWDSPMFQRVYDKELLPALKAAGVTVKSEQKVNPTDAGTVESGLLSAITNFQFNGVDRVVFLGGAPLASFFLTSAGSYRPRYGMTTFDAPRYGEQNLKNQLEGMVGIGFNPAGDVSDHEAPMPANPTEKLCLDIFKSANQTFATRAEARTPLAFCESTLLLQAGARNLKPGFSVPQWSAEAARLGTSYQSATGISTSLSATQHDGAAAWRPIAFDGGCGCVRYTGPPKPF
jgi:hypothetical protein